MNQPQRDVAQRSGDERQSVAGPDQVLIKLGAAAVAYAERGWRVFPVKPKGKEPMFTGSFKNASADPEVVRKIWLKHPTANSARPVAELY